jgi:hypothetical protein
MIDSSLTQNRRATKAGIPHGPAVLGGFVPSCESIFHDGDCARGGSIGNNQFTEMQTTVSGSGTLSFYWKVSSEENYDWLEFYLDGVR